MSNSYYFRRRTIGRAASPPTWACYEQIPYDYSSSSSSGSPSPSDDEHSHDSSDEEEEELNMDIDSPSLPPSSPETTVKVMDKGKAKEEEGKGKQRAVEESKDSRRRRERQRRGERERMYTLRPILTIQRSQGFVWNQDLFVPPYIKDRYVASTSPPNSRCFIPSTSASSTNSALTDYEVEVVEIRVREGELRDIIP